MAMLNNFTAGFVGDRTSAFPLNHGVASGSAADMPSAAKKTVHVASGSDTDRAHGANFKSILNRASNEGHVSKQNVNAGNKPHKDNKKHNGPGLVLCANVLHADIKHVAKDSPLMKSANIPKNDIGDKKAVTNADLKGDMKSKKTDNTGGNLPNKKLVSDEIPVTNLHFLSESGSNQLSKGIAGNKLITPRTMPKSKDKKNINIDSKDNKKSNKMTGKDDIKGKSNLADAINIAIHNYEKKTDLTRLNSKNSNNTVINTGNLLNGTGLLHSNFNNLNGNNAGLNNSSGQISSLMSGKNESTGTIAVNSVMFMIKKDIQSAVITLKPPSLGHVKVEIAMKNITSNLNNSADKGKTITINMLAQNDAARNILQASSPNLQNALKGQGFSSINLNINLNSGGNGQGRGNNEGVNKNPFKNFVGGLLNADKDAGSIADMRRYSYNPLAIIDYFI